MSEQLPLWAAGPARGNPSSSRGQAPPSRRQDVAREAIPCDLPGCKWPRADRPNARYCCPAHKRQAWDDAHRPRIDPPVSDPPEARRRRDEGLARVEESGGTWQERAGAALVRLCASRAIRQAPWEDYKAALLAGGLEAPHHFNAWGAVVRRATRSGLLVRVGYTTSSAPASHGTEARIYRVVG